MRSSQRKIIAILAGKILGQKGAKMLYDHESKQFSNFRISNSRKGFIIRDLELGLELYVEKKPIKWHIFNNRTGKYIDLEIFNENFRGYDYASSNYFTISQQGQELKVYDYETDDYHYYSLE